MSRIQKTPTEIKAKRLHDAHNKAKLSNKKKKKKPKRRGLSADHLRGKPYWVFLNSPYWLEVRRRVLIRDEKKCRICRSTEKLEIHHDTYKHHFYEHKHLDDLLTLCSDCHREHHLAQP